MVDSFNEHKVDTTLLNKRIQFEDQLATVRYVGPVPPTKGEWLGVEWDNVVRGKHDGLHEGTRYFTCSVSNSGTFIRFSPKINTGRSFVAALINKYIEYDGDGKIQGNEEETYDAQKDLDTLYWAGNTKIEVEALGWDKIRRKQRKLDLLTEVGLSFEQISNAGNLGEIEATCPNIIDLNLSKNLLSDWETVAHICQELKKLEVLRLNYNRFQPLKSVPNFSNAFLNLKNLSLNHTRISWDQIELLEPSFPSLENLQLGFNNIRLLYNNENEKENHPVNKVKGFVKLKVLNLESNGIDSWDTIAFFSDLPCLETLFLNNNLIERIFYTKENENSKGFSKLQYLNVNENKINDWNSIDELNKFPSLNELRIKKNPFLDNEKPTEANMSIIGRIKGLSALNGSIISSGDRVDAERFYLRVCVKDLKKTPEEIEKEHPRFKELCELHGTPFVDEISMKATSNVLRDRLLALTITSRPSLEQDPIKKISKKLLGTMEIRNLKNLLQKLFGIPASRQQLFAVTNYQTEKGTTVLKMEMNDDLRQLSYYDISSGDEIVILSN
ncbi:5927_t:CDS:10 [Dentiscutata erythropus]|uniref:5927_t:CDS:1 n=1 Tax=Dentiscutata erythropus TaxID=1348616 RepID=A0A9N9A9M7_9GLOM|nr:5927_t:CDS:10 [Dentiscutata erythropus]